MRPPDKQTFVYKDYQRFQYLKLFRSLKQKICMKLTEKYLKQDEHTYISRLDYTILLKYPRNHYSKYQLTKIIK